MSTITKRILALVLCFVMLVGVMPVSALAEDTAEDTTVTEEVTPTTAATSEPTETTAPAATSEPTETTAPAESSEPTETTAPAESSEPTGPSVPAEDDTASGEDETEPTVDETEPKSRTAFGLTRASTVLDAAIFCSDVHGNPSTVTSVFNGIKSADSTFDPSTASFVGDTDGSTSTVTSNAQSVFSGVECLYAYGSHDSGYVSDVTGLLYGDSSTNYYVYAISQSSMESSNPSTSGFTSTVAGLDKSKPLFIISHMPLHSRRGDNNGAAAWYTAISAAAEQMDIAFFWAHNHTGDNGVDQAAYYVAKDGSETITVEGGSTVTPNFTYLNAGYIDPPNNAARMNVATAVRIYDDFVNYTVYNSSGELSGTYAVNETVTREFASGSSSGGDSGETTDPTDPTEPEGGTTTETKEVYVLVDTMTVGEDYLIANGNTGTVTLLGQSSGSSTTTTATVVTEGDYTYIETADDAYVWNATAHPNSSYSSYPRLINAETYAMYASSGSLAFSSSLTSTSGAVYTRYWTYTDGVLSCPSTNSSSTTYYMNSSFGLSSSSTTGIYIYEKQTIDVETEVTLSSIEMQVGPSTTVYNVGDTFSAEGMVVNAVYSDGSVAAVTGYTVSEVDMTTAGTKTVTVTYTEGEVTKETTFQIVVNEVISENATVTAIEVTGAKTEYTLGEPFSYEGLTVTATYDDNGTTKTKVLSEEEYTVTEPDMTTEGTKTVTVSYTFNGTTVTDTYDITVTEKPSNEVTLGNSGVEKTVYVLVDSITSGEEYLIVNTNSVGTGYGLGNSTSGDHAVSIASGTLTIDGTSGTYTYIEDKGDALEWTATGSNSSVTFASGDYKLGTTGSGGNRALTVSSSSSWVFTGSAMYYDGKNDYYVAYSGGAWGISSSNTSSRNVYLYQKVTINTSTEVKYTMRANDLKQVVDTNNTATLTAELDFCLQGNGSDLTSLPSGGSYSFTVLSDESDIIDSIGTDGTVNFTGTIGTATVKVAYTWTQDGKTYTVYKNITVETSEPYYSIDLHKQTTDDSGNPAAGEEITSTVAVKGVESGDTYSVWAVVKYYDGSTEDGVDQGDVEDNMIEWTSSDPTVATVDPATGVITFTGKDGTVNITATYLGGNKPSDTITISATASQYNVPSDGTTDFPEYPNEGAIRYDKTATAVGNFSETGIAQVELSMTGVPYTTGSEMDVVLMLDITGSMHDVTTSSYTYSKYTRVEATIIAAMEFVKSIVVNEDGSYNNNRVGVYSFNSGGTYTLWELGTVTNLDTINAAIQKFNDNYATGGTPYDDGLSKVQSVLAAAKTDGTGNNRKQFAVFMTDGVPTDYEYITGSTHANYSSASSIAGMLTSSDNYQTRDTDYYYEYYSTEMKGDGITVYTVGIGLENTNSAWSGSATQCLNLASRLLNDISGPAGESTQPDAVGTSTLSKQDSYFYSVDDANAATDMKNVFTNIATKILQAATDVTVEDKITDEYTMIFDIPTGDKTISDVTNDFYIEFLKYTLDANHERVDSDSDGDTYDDATSVTKLYLKNTNGVYSAAKDSSGTAYDAPTFAQTTIGDKGTLFYWTTDSTYSAKAAVSYNDGTNTYYFIPYGLEANEDGTAPDGWYNMTSGGYAYGTVDSTTNMSENLVIATPYFVYNAGTKMLYWTVDKLDTTEYALRYFLYLDQSATEVGTADEVDAGTYPTNDHAYITYTNFKGNDCQQKFPVPQLTWSGAQVSYVFYLVNSAGQPINKSGQVVDFANATFITDIYTTAVVWNKGADGQIEGDANLSIDWLANELLPSEYAVYDEQAGYELHVYGDHTGASIFDYFVIEGDTAANISSSLNSRLDLETAASTVSVETTKVYNTKAGTKYDDYGVYTSEATDAYDGETVLPGFDFANTTVAFAVVWEPKLVPDTVVVDYGLDVVINVVQNDILQNTVNGIGTGTDAYGNTKINTGVSAESKLGTAALNIDGNTISIENENTVRFHQGDMEFATPAVFYYETPVAFYENSEKKEGYMYSSVTVIPATTIYYEDEFVDLSSYTWSDGWVETDAANTWTQVGTTISATQAQDRPGTSQISADLDADNIYGYDEAYSSCSMYSLGSAMKAHVDYDNYAQAEFSFYGTGFDVISLTSNQTGAIIMEVADKDGNIVRNNTVDTYYGYTQNSDGEWVISENDPNALYQVPVMEIAGLEYGKYTVKIMAVYDVIFDHSQYTTTDAETGEAISAEQYDFYLDAIRIYDPANDGASEEGTVVEEAYEKDKESWPVYEEIRNNVITEAELEGADEVAGIVFIDSADETASVGDYTSYGPNNELYLAPGQAIAFSLNLSGYTMLNESGDTVSSVEAVHVGLKSASGNVPVGYKIFDGGSVATSDDVADVKAESVETATGMYYDITALKDNVIVIYNSGTTGILSLTDVKVTFKQDPGVVENLFYTSAAVIAKLVENMNTPAVTIPTVFTVTTTPTTATAGSRVTVTVTTSADVAAVSVDGTMITTYSVQNGNRIWKFYVSTPDEGSQEIVVNTYNEDGYQSDTKTVTVTVNSVEATVVSAIRSVYDIIKKLFNW